MDDDSSEEAATQIAYDKRYVDPSFEPIAATQVKAVLGGAELPENNLELIVAKRVPFRIAVEIDERKINEFIAICANSEFVFEVNQLRVNRHLSHPGEIKFNGGAVVGSNTLRSSMDDGMEDDEYTAEATEAVEVLQHRAGSLYQLPSKAEQTSWSRLSFMAL